MNFHQTAEHAAFLRSIGWQTPSHDTSQGTQWIFIRTLPFVPVSLMKIQRIALDSLDWDWITFLQRKYHVYETDIEPEGLFSSPPLKVPELTSRGFKPGCDYMLTTKTRVVHLSQSESALLSAMKPKTRYNIHLAEKRLETHILTAEEVCRSSTLFDIYYALLQQNARRVGMLLLPKNWIFKQIRAFSKHGFIISATQHNTSEWLAASLFFISKTTCSYSHNGSIALGRQLMAPSLVIWEGMKEGKRRGLIEFDFDGVYDERYPERQKRFKGFGRFKAGFGGDEGYFHPMYKQLRWPFGSVN